MTTDKTTGPSPTAPEAPEAAAATAAAEASHASKNNIPLVFASLMLGMLLVSLGQTIFATALPTVVGELGGVDQMSWVITAFLLAQTIGLPIYGKLGDQVGRKPLFIFALSMYLIGSVVGALGQSIWVIIIARAIQGLGGGGMMVLSQAIIADIIPARQRGKYMGLMGSVFGLSSVLGPLLGGFFTDGPGWRWALWFNVPLALVAIVIAVFAMHLPARGDGKARLDVWGTVFMAGFATCLILFLSWGGKDYEWGSATIIGLIVATVVCAVLFVLAELRAKEPLIPMALFANRNFVLCTLAGLVIGVVMLGTLSYMPTYIQMVHGMSPTKAGLMMIPMILGMMPTSIVVGIIVSRTGRYKWYPVVGMFITAVGLFLLGGLQTHDSLLHLGLVLFVFGFGLGCAMQILVLMVQNAFPVSMVGTATASNNFFRQIGMSVGSAVVGSVFTSRLQTMMGERVPAAMQEMGPEAAPYADSFSSSGSHSITPDMVSHLPGALHEAVITSYNDALVPIFTVLIPLAVVAGVVLLFTRQDKLKDTVE
ncbi:MDR family MFS transporter [Corynebacterium kalidii]|uniref:MFS transporter n=1 Tax=Corynebacterium kalidii TaxID=2931982 RepID=A0A9X1WKG0_9CORY|nr:MDR family MFS transporter [Corynebacterium kalidii]MCJ7859192.1 MFS transporter [Corynebacterium kalidii]